MSVIHSAASVLMSSNRTCGQRDVLGSVHSAEDIDRATRADDSKHSYCCVLG
jgi:hypothetical protein